MKTHKTICIGCGKEIEFGYFEVGDASPFLGSKAPVDEDEAGWWDHECSCGWYTDFSVVELRVSGDLEGFVCCLETPLEVRNFAKALLKEHPELFEKESND